MPSDGQTIVDGSLDFSLGVDSLKVPTIQSQAHPNGLERSKLSWLVNGSVRDGGISPRWGWQPLGTITGAALYQGGYMYQPQDGSNPYPVLSISGKLYKVVPSAAGQPGGVAVTPLTSGALLNSVTAPQAWFEQAEDFLIVQPDGAQLPLFYDGNTVRRSLGIHATGAGTPSVSEIPAATAMKYFMGRLWYAQGRVFTAGDIVYGGSGTAPYNHRDSVLEVTENPLATGGDGFSVPANSGNIRALFYNANLNSQLGQGMLMAGTRKGVFAQTIPIARADWIAANADKQPLQVPVQLNNGPVNDRSVVLVNGDVFFQSLEPAVRSLKTTLRYFNEWNNPALSSNLQRVLRTVDRNLLHLASGVSFQSTMFQTTLPIQMSQGVVHQGVMPLDFMPLSTFGSDLNPVWSGIQTGINILQLFVGDFGGFERMFAVAVQTDGSLGLWEMTPSSLTDNGDNRITMAIEFPSFTWGREFDLKDLVSAELWVDQLSGQVDCTMEYRPDGDTCWQPWYRWQMCSARTSAEAGGSNYPVIRYAPGYRQMVTLPKPTPVCETSNGRPSNILYQCQPRLTIHGSCRVRGLLLHALKVQRELYSGIVC